MPYIVSSFQSHCQYPEFFVFSLEDIQSVNKINQDIPFLEKALLCYESDIHKAEDTGHEYFVKLIGDMAKARDDLGTIKIALGKIKQYSE